MHLPPVNWSNLPTLLVACCLAAPLPLGAQSNSMPQMSERVLPASTDLPPTTPPLPQIGQPLPLRLADAIALTLEKDPNIKLQEQQVLISRGVLQEAVGAFDPAITGQMQGSYSTTDDDESVDYSTYALATGAAGSTSGGFLNDVQDALSLQFAIQKVFRNGITLAPQITITDDLTQVTGESTDSTEAFVGFTLVIPLAQGLGPNNASYTTELSSAVDVGSEISSLEFTAAQEIYNTGTAYWSTLLAQTNVRISRSNETAAQRLVEITKSLISGYVEPAIQLAQANANLEQYAAQRIAAQQQQSQSSQQLAIAMGFTPSELFSEPLVVDTFPNPHQDDVLTPDRIRGLIEIALARRADVRASRQSIVSSQYLVNGARNNTLPQIDLIVGGGLQQATTRQSTNTNTTRDTQHGVAVSASLSIDWPIYNNVAEGQLVQAKGELNQARISSSQTESQVASDVINAAKSVILMRQALEEAIESAKDAMTSVQAQQTLFQMGMTSLTEVITTQTNLANAQLTVATYASQYANAILQLRFATGTLLPIRDPKGGYRLDMQELARVPRPQAR